MSDIADKTTMRALYRSGAFGNQLQLWALQDALRGDVRWPIGFMYNGRPGARLPGYASQLWSAAEVEALLRKWIELGCSEHLITVSETDTSIRRVLQGEVMRSEDYFSLTYTTVDDFMRPALAQQTLHAHGLRALMLLRETMDMPSWENLQRLFDEYPDSVIEFSCYANGVGSLGHNTVFWEVRNY